MTSATVNALEQGTVILEVVFHRPGIHRRGDMAEIETSADKSQLGLNKRIVESPEYKYICKIASACRSYLRDLELHGPFKTGRHLIPISLLEQAYDRVLVDEEKYQEAVEAFLVVYPAQKEIARAALANQFNEADYPSVSALRRAFWVEKRVTQWATPGASQIGEYLYAKERDRVQVELTALADEAKIALREGIAGLAEKLAHALGVKDNGHRQTLQPGTLRKVLEWLALFDKRDILDDKDLGSVVNTIRSALDGKSLDDLRTNRGVRDSVKETLDGAVKQLHTLLADGPGRIVSFEDDE